MMIKAETKNYDNVNIYYQYCLKGKFSSGIEGALASTSNHDFKWK